MHTKESTITTNIAPWLSVHNGANAIIFYKAAFNAIETYHQEFPDGGIVAKLSIDGAEFWLSSSVQNDSQNTETLGGENIRIILTVQNPDSLIAKALLAGAKEVGRRQRFGRIHLIHQTEPFAALDPVAQGRQHAFRPHRGFDPRPVAVGG